MAPRSSLSGDAGPSRVPRNQDPRSFTADVVAVLRALRPGQVVTYGEVAAEAGHPGAARAVGNVLRVVTDVAWWRVVAASGRVNPNAVGEATRRLTAEGVQVRDGRVTASPCGRVGSALGRRREETTMSGDGGRLPDDTPSAPERSGPSVQEGVDEAAADSERADGVLRPPEQSAPGTAPVEQVADDPAMTEGRSDRGSRPPGADDLDEPAAPVEETPVSGGMQSDPGARPADRQAGAPRPSDVYESGRDD